MTKSIQNYQHAKGKYFFCWRRGIIQSKEGGSAVAQWKSAWIETEGPRVRACVTALCPWARHINPNWIVLVQPRKTRPFITERLLMGRKESNQINKQSKEEDKDQESIQLSTTPDLGHHMRNWQKHKKTSHTKSREVSWCKQYQGCHGQGKSSGKWKFQVREKSGNYIFSQGNLKQMKKVREFQNFPKKMLVNRLLEILVSIIFSFHNLQAILEKEFFWT